MLSLLYTQLIESEIVPYLMPQGLAHDDAHRCTKFPIHLFCLFDYRKPVESDRVWKCYANTILAAALG